MPHPFQPDLPDWAQRQFALAGELCRGCRAYHATFGYRRLSGLIGGVEADQAALEALLEPLLAGPLRVLVAGSADTGIIALLHRLAGDLATLQTWLVVDRCETPLAACRAYAHERGLALQTLRSDLRALPLEGVADLAIAHSILGFADAAGRAAMLQRLARALAPGGRLVLAARLAAEGQSTTGQPLGKADIGQRWAGEVGQAVTQALQERAIALPCAAADFEHLLQQCAGRLEHSSPYQHLDELETELAGSGFEVLQRQPGGRGLAFLDDGSIERAGRPSWVLLARVRDER